MRETLNELHRLISEMDSNPDKHTAPEILTETDRHLTRFTEVLNEEMRKAHAENSADMLPLLIEQVEDFSFLMSEINQKLKTKTAPVNDQDNAKRALPF